MSTVNHPMKERSRAEGARKLKEANEKRAKAALAIKKRSEERAALGKPKKPKKPKTE